MILIPLLVIATLLNGLHATCKYYMIDGETPISLNECSTVVGEDGTVSFQVSCSANGSFVYLMYYNGSSCDGDIIGSATQSVAELNENSTMVQCSGDDCTVKLQFSYYNDADCSGSPNYTNTFAFAGLTCNDGNEFACSGDTYYLLRYGDDDEDCSGEPSRLTFRTNYCTDDMTVVSVAECGSDAMPPPTTTNLDEPKHAPNYYYYALNETHVPLAPEHCSCVDANMSIYMMPECVSSDVIKIQNYSDPNCTVQLGASQTYSEGETDFYCDGVNSYVKLLVFKHDLNCTSDNAVGVVIYVAPDVCLNLDGEPFYASTKIDCNDTVATYNIYGNTECSTSTFDSYEFPATCEDKTGRLLECVHAGALQHTLSIFYIGFFFFSLLFA